MDLLASGPDRSGRRLWGRPALWATLWLRLVRNASPEDRQMMSGVISETRPHRVCPRHYEVVARAGGWSVVLNGACTRPFRSRRAAERIAKSLQKQADALNGMKPQGQAH
ncbi:MAG: hypothetical protein EBR82_23195 [Caulobacteraceae bacterium]|nr:hypothetical protein [Caulobacteraceae bacterium]